MVTIVRGNPWFWVAVAIAMGLAGGLRAERYQATAEGAKPQAAVSDAASSTADATVGGQLEQVVVLQDGGVMRGRVSRDGERYVLARGTGQTFIPASNVMFVAASFEDAYQQRCQRLSGATADNHLMLAEWCLRNDLLAHAETELAAARTIEPHHGKLEPFERRLSLGKERLQKQAVVVARVAKDSKPVILPARDAPTDFGDLPPGVVERFTRKVQPVLVNSCTTAGCHESGGTAKFQLDRAMLRGLSNRRTTMSNLAATLQLVDREQPRLSPLLTVPRRTHGGMSGPVLGPRREAAFRHLYEWVALVTAETAKTSPAPASVEGVELVAEQREPLNRWDSSVMRVERQTTAEGVPAIYQEQISANTPDGVESQSPDEASSTTARSPLRYGARFEHWQPRDAFDPEIFNRKYGRVLQTSGEAPRSTLGTPTSTPPGPSPAINR